jgi:hypothetical protein
MAALTRWAQKAAKRRREKRRDASWPRRPDEDATGAHAHHAPTDEE